MSARKIALIIVGCITFFTCALIALALILMTAIKSSGGYQAGVDLAKKHEWVVEQIGSPVTEGFWVLGNVNLQNSNGQCDLQVSLIGPKGKLNLRIDAVKRNGSWTVRTLTGVKNGVSQDLLLENRGFDHTQGTRI